MSHLPVGIDWGIFGGYSLTGIFRVYSRYIANIPRISPGDNWGQCAVDAMGDVAKRLKAAEGRSRQVREEQIALIRQAQL